MDKMNHIYIKNVEEYGKFVAINNYKTELMILFKPDNNDALFSVVVDKDLYINRVTEMVNVPSFNQIKISKINIDDFSNETYYGLIGLDNKKGYKKFILKAGKLEIIDDAVIVIDSFSVIPDYDLISFKQIGNIIYGVGSKKQSGCDLSEYTLYLEYDMKSKQIIQEITFYSDKGDIYLNCINIVENTVYIGGHIAVFVDNKFSHNEPYITTLIK